MRCRALLVSLLSLASGSAVISAQPSTCVPQLIGADRRGPAKAISRSGNTLYLAAGAAIVVVDTTDLLNPIERGYVNLDELVLDVAHWQTTAIALGEHGLSFIDASDPAQPEVVGVVSFPAGWTVRSITARDELVYFPEVNGLHVVDFSEPTQPVEIGGFPVSDARDFVLNGDRAYLLAGNSILVLDVSNPATPSQIASVATEWPEKYHLSIAGNGGRLAVFGNWSSGHHDGSSADFYSLADPGLPAWRSGLFFDEWYMDDVEFSENRAYVSELIYYVGDLSNPVYLGSFWPLLWGRDMARTPDVRYLFVADPRSGLHVADVLDPTNPQIAASVAMPEETTDGYLAGSLAVAVNRHGLRTFDISDPAHPTVLGSLDLADGYLERVVHSGPIAYVTSNGDAQDQLLLVDFGEPSAPQVIGSIPWSHASWPAASGNLLVVRESCDEAVALYDISEPADPLRLSEIYLSDDCSGMDFTAAGRRLYLWQSVGGYPTYPQELHTYDIGNPAGPIELAHPDYSPPHYGTSLAVGRQLFLGERERLAVVSVADPSAPILLGSLPLPRAYEDRVLSIYGSRLLVPTPLYNENDHRVRVVDVSIPSAPTEWALLDTPGYGYSAFAGPGVIVVADGPAGISIYSSCVPFADGFESGDTSEWSEMQP